MEAKDIKDIEAITGAKVVAATKENSSFNSDFVLLDDNGVIRQAFTVRDINGKMCIIPPMYESESISAALAHLNMTDEELAQNIDFINPQTPNPENNTPTTMNANETKNANIAHAERIYKEIDNLKIRGAWKNGVKTYALMLIDWYIYEANERPLTLDTLLNGADNWKQYAYGACGVSQAYNTRIAETLCPPSVLRRTNGGLKDPNLRETWLDIESHALYQAYLLIQKFNNK